MLGAAWDGRSALPATGDVNGDGAISALDGPLMYHACTFRPAFELETDVGTRVRGFPSTLRGMTSIHTDDDDGYKDMLAAAWRLQGTERSATTSTPR